MCSDTVRRLESVLNAPNAQCKPVFGICLGHQLMALAAGATSYKMKHVSLPFFLLSLIFENESSFSRQVFFNKFRYCNYM